MVLVFATELYFTCWKRCSFPLSTRKQPSPKLDFPLSLHNSSSFFYFFPLPQVQLNNMGSAVSFFYCEHILFMNFSILKSQKTPHNHIFSCLRAMQMTVLLIYQLKKSALFTSAFLLPTFFQEASCFCL